MTTVGGLVFRLFGRLPRVGESVDYEGYRFVVLEVDGLRISRLRVSETADQLKLEDDRIDEAGPCPIDDGAPAALPDQTATSNQTATPDQEAR